MALRVIDSVISDTSISTTNGYLYAKNITYKKNGDQQTLIIDYYLFTDKLTRDDDNMRAFKIYKKVHILTVADLAKDPWDLAYEIAIADYTDTVVVSDIIDENGGTGDSGGTKLFTPTLVKNNIEKKSVRIKDKVGGQVITDDGDGNLIGDVDSAGTNTINYATGAIDVTFNNAPGDGDAVEIDYSYV